MSAGSRLKSAGEPSAFPRRHVRVRVLLSAKLITTTDEAHVKIRDLSLSGAMLQGRSLPVVGSDLILSRGGFEVFATVIWSRGDTCGVEFDSPLASLEELLQAGGLSTTFDDLQSHPQHQPLQAAARLTFQEMEAAREWVRPSGRRAYLD